MAMTRDAIPVRDAAPPRHAAQADAQDVSRGYKQTEVGVIPDDWRVATLSTLVAAGPKNGYSGRNGMHSRGTPTLSLGATTSGQLVLSEETIKWLEETIEAGSDLFLRPGDVLVQRSNTAELVGTTAVYSGPPGVYVYPDLMMRLRFRDTATAQWFWRFANGTQGRRYFMSIAAGSSGSMPKISGTRLRSMPIPLPSPHEQRAIAEALSDVDGLLAALEALIAKKRAIKQAAMQQLLTGKTRLPGFSGEWESQQVRDVITGYFCGPSPACEERNISGEEEWGVLKTTAATVENGWAWTQHKALPRAYWGREHQQVRVGDVIITKAGPRHRVGVSAWVDYVPDRIIVSGKMIGLRPNAQKAVPLILAAALGSRHTQRFLDERTTGMAESQVNFENQNVLEAPLRLPPIDEQRAIAAVLSDMDAEIAAFEARRDKTRAIKQGMMQQLLTGRVRLVKPEAAA